ncbi:hypothetical protein BJ170DRAFT_89711 [Xylariales sp. AK1849]|nr:hypothetical protein BJ170DRAFT_89711 [Xylariales sp. AK1849]
MCFYDQTVWACGFWKWGSFRSQCDKEYRIGHTCGLKLIWSTEHRDLRCTACQKIAKKRRRITKMTQDIERWRGEGNRAATIERTEQELSEARAALARLYDYHAKNQRLSIGECGQ